MEKCIEEYALTHSADTDFVSCLALTIGVSEPTLVAGIEAPRWARQPVSAALLGWMIHLDDYSLYPENDKAGVDAPAFLLVTPSD